MSSAVSGVTVDPELSEIISRVTTPASAMSATASRTNTARMLVAARKPLTIGLSARPTSDAVVRSPKPAPRAEAGITRACRRVSGRRRDADGEAEDRCPDKEKPGAACDGICHSAHGAQRQHSRR